MDFKQFRTKWLLVSPESDLTTYDYSNLENTDLSQEAKDFLVTGGIPKETWHNSMTFNEKIYGSNIVSLKDQVSLINNDFAHYYVIGSVENGWICINSNLNNKIIIVDVEYPNTVDSGKSKRSSSDRYQGEQFMNSSLPKMAECVLAYQRFCQESEVDDQSINNLQNSMREIDLACMEENTFWWYETQTDTLNADL